jgi:hypothetical protein
LFLAGFEFGGVSILVPGGKPTKAKVKAKESQPRTDQTPRWTGVKARESQPNAKKSQEFATLAPHEAGCSRTRAMFTDVDECLRLLTPGRGRGMSTSRYPAMVSPPATLITWPVM